MCYLVNLSWCVIGYKERILGVLPLVVLQHVHIPSLCEWRKLLASLSNAGTVLLLVAVAVCHS